jgi:N-acetylglucosaminyl-diphospho-decaprenol L-rhamnosyltransferase
LATVTEPHLRSEDLSFVVVSWRSAALLEALVASIGTHVPTGAELIAVENGSGEDLRSAASGFPGESRVIALGESLGFGEACNAGVDASTRPVTIMINPDCELLDAGVLALAGLARRRRALAGPRLLNPDGSIQPSAAGSPTGLWPWLCAVVPGSLQPAPLLAHTEPWRLGAETEVAWLTGACVAAPREVLVSLGPFDPALAIYAEDMDLGLRARRRGVPSLFCPHLCSVRHVGGASTAQAFDPREAAMRSASNRRAVLRRHYGQASERLARRALMLNLGLRSTVKRSLGRDGSAELRELAATRHAREAPRLPDPPG